MAEGGSLIDEADAGAGVHVAIIHAAPAAAVPIEIHLADEEPAAGVDGLDVRDVAGAARALHARLHHHRRPRDGNAAGAVAARRRAAEPVERVAHVGEVFILPLP